VLFRNAPEHVFVDDACNQGVQRLTPGFLGEQQGEQAAFADGFRPAIGEGFAEQLVVIGPEERKWRDESAGAHPADEGELRRLPAALMPARTPAPKAPSNAPPDKASRFMLPAFPDKGAHRFDTHRQAQLVRPCIGPVARAGNTGNLCDGLLAFSEGCARQAGASGKQQKAQQHEDTRERKIGG
jgi:hypothetical protein